MDGLDVTNVPMGTVIDALRGTPGATRTLLLERAGKRITVQATVVRLPSQPRCSYFIRKSTARAARALVPTGSARSSTV